MTALGNSEPMLTTIACDESASEGENLMSAKHPVFVHASTDLTVNEAEAFIDDLRVATRTQAVELKSKVALAPQNRRYLLRALESVRTRGNIHLVDKTFYVTAKLVDLLMAAHADDFGAEIRYSGLGRYYTTVLADRAPADVGATFWNMLLRRYNDFVRVHAREPAAAPTRVPFLTALATAIERATDPAVASVLQQLWHARLFAAEYEGARVGTFREMDPAFTTLPAVARTWRIRLGNVPLELLIDTYAPLTTEVQERILAAVQDDIPVAGRTLPAADLRSIRQVESHNDARVQVADILAGVGRTTASLAFEGTFDDDLQRVTSEMLDLQGMWSDQSALDQLYECRPPQYAHDIEQR